MGAILVSTVIYYSPFTPYSKWKHFHFGKMLSCLISSTENFRFEMKYILGFPFPRRMRLHGMVAHSITPHHTKFSILFYGNSLHVYSHSFFSSDMFSFVADPRIQTKVHHTRYFFVLRNSFIKRQSQLITQYSFSFKDFYVKLIVVWYAHFNLPKDAQKHGGLDESQRESTT